MSFFKKLKDMFSGKERRKLERDELKKFLKVQVLVDGSKYPIHDISIGSFALVAEGKSSFEVGKVYSCTFTVRGEPKLTIKSKVLRIEGNKVGCEVLDRGVFENFVNYHFKV